MSGNTYKSDDIVWAKLRGFSWWPAMVSRTEKSRNSSETMVVVNFIGENSHAVLPLDKVVHYREGYEQFSATKKKSLLDAIASANRIEAGDTTFKGMSFSL